MCRCAAMACSREHVVFITHRWQFGVLLSLRVLQWDKRWDRVCRSSIALQSWSQDCLFYSICAMRKVFFFFLPWWLSFQPSEGVSYVLHLQSVIEVMLHRLTRPDCWNMSTQTLLIMIKYPVQSLMQTDINVGVRPTENSSYRSKKSQSIKIFLCLFYI